MRGIRLKTTDKYGGTPIETSQPVNKVKKGPKKPKKPKKKK